MFRMNFPVRFVFVPFFVCVFAVLCSVYKKKKCVFIITGGKSQPDWRSLPLLQLSLLYCKVLTVGGRGFCGMNRPG